jgi:hypothetical protein
VNETKPYNPVTYDEMRRYIDGGQVRVDQSAGKTWAIQSATLNRTVLTAVA